MSPSLDLVSHPEVANTSDTRPWQMPTFAGVLTAVATYICHLLDWLGGDLPGALLRAETFRQGNYVRVPNWFGGFPNVTYSFLLSPFGALVGVQNLMALSAGVATAAVAVITSSAPSRRRIIAVGCFGLAMVSTATVGRATYLLGAAFATWAMVALIRSGQANRRSAHAVAAVAAAFATGLSSPVAGLFLAIASFGLLVQQRRWIMLCIIGAAGVGPSTLANMYFGTQGALPTTWATALTVAALFLVFVIGSRSVAVRISAALGIAACLVVGMFDTPLTYIIKRLPETVGSAAASATVRKWLAIPLIAGLAGWNALAIVNSTRETGRGERSGAAFASLTAKLQALAPTGTVEVVPTKLHWETWYVARAFPIARGWERQADIDHGPFFYDNKPISAAQYREWLAAEDVQFIALSDLEIDRAGLYEAQLLRSGDGLGSSLSLEWSSDGWTVWRVNDFESTP